MPSLSDIKAAALAELWHRGEAWRHLADAGQREWLGALHGTQGASLWCISRQRGKSYAALLYALGEMQRTPGMVVRYAALTGKSAAAIVLPTLAQALETCPASLAPIISAQHGTVTLRNGSSLTWAGTDNEQFDRLRGPRAHLVLLDESAFYADLERVERALLPQLTTTQGRVLYLSTPPETPAHPFVARMRAAQAAQRYRHATVWDNPRLGKAGVEALAKAEAERLGLTLEELFASTYWRREYLAEVVTEESRAAVPGWNEDAHKAIVREHQRPKHFDGYVGLDFGFGDPHAALLGFWDFEAAKFVIEDEVCIRAGTTETLADAVKAREAALWGASRWEGTLLGAGEFEKLPDWLQPAVESSRRAPRQPYLRVGDNDPLVLADLMRLHGLVVLPSRKDDKALAVNELDLMVRRRELVIHPRCTGLVRQLYSTLWNARRTEWERNSDGHGDLIDALVYLVRNLRKHRDPRPPPPRDEWSDGVAALNGEDKRAALAKAFGVRR